MKILNFGSCNIDLVYSLDHIVSPGETETSDNLNIFPGGKGLNQSIALARAGADVYHAGCIGNDGEFLAELLKDSGVNISHLKRVDEKNGHAVIQVTRDGENSIFLYPGSNRMITEEHIDSVLSCFGSGDIILLQNEISNLEYIVKSAYDRGMKIILNPSPCDDEIKKIDFSMLYCIIVNEGEVKTISGCDEARDALMYLEEKYPSLRVMLTLGKGGCIYQDDENMIYHPIYEVEAVDTTAAGDTFTGYFVSGIASGKKWREILSEASCASAISVSRHGAAPSIPDMEEVRKYQKILKLSSHDTREEKLRRKIEEYISDNLRDASVEGLASVLGYSSVYSGALVKKLFDKKFKQYLQDKRLCRSEKLLRETDMPVGEIIKECGYENDSFFREIFKEKYGKNLLEYRKYTKGDKSDE